MADLFEEYKEALKKGHVAVLRGELHDAIEHYRAAAAIAPDRPLPYSSLGGVLLRLGRTAEAVGAYEEAVRRGPTDETALGGQSDALLSAGRRAEAAQLLDRLATVQLEKGRQPEALATRGLARAVRAAGGIPEPDTGQEPLAPSPPRAGEPASPPVEHGAAPPDGSQGAGQISALRAAMSAPAQAIPDAAASNAAGTDGATPEVASPDAPEPEPEIAAPPREPTPAELVGEAEQATLDGRTDEAVRAYVRAAGGYRQLAALDAGLDACQQALTLAPGSPDVHLAMAGLYFDRGWQERAAEKLVLLDRLLQLQAPNGWRDELLSLASEHQADDPRLAALTARHAGGEPVVGGD
jgi:tetratricopeptide (TPR) repeat protein